MGWGPSPACTASRADKSGKGIEGSKGCSSAPTPSPRLGVAASLAAPRVAQRGRGHPWEGAPAPPRSTAGGSRGPRCPQGRRGLREHSPVWVCFSFPLRWRPGSPRSACCSGPHWVPRRRLPLPTPPRRAAPSFSGPVTCAREPHLSSSEEVPGAVPLSRADSAVPLVGRVSAASCRFQAPPTQHAVATTRRWGKPCPSAAAVTTVATALRAVLRAEEK